MLRILDITGPDILLGLGIRCSLWISGCKHHCPYCQNSWTWDYNQGKEYKTNKNFILKTISDYLDKPYYKGITISGGDPLYQDDEALYELYSIIVYIRNNYPDKDIWLYTGFTLDEIRNSGNPLLNNIIDNLDVLVDGQFINELKNISLKFKGSSNQIIWKRVNGKFEKSELN